VQEIYAIDEDSLRALGYSPRSFSAKFTTKCANQNCSPAYGMIFLFRWKPEPMDSTEDTCPEHVWFANQVGPMPSKCRNDRKFMFTATGHRQRMCKPSASKHCLQLRCRYRTATETIQRVQCTVKPPYERTGGRKQQAYPGYPQQLC
jgi:hypothetical protein